MQPRGIRLNNPLNIRKGIEWQGLEYPNDDAEFCRFSMPEYGIRAGCKIFQTYSVKYGLHTLSEWIHRFAPNTENDTEAYVKHVCSESGFGPHDTVDPFNPEHLHRILPAFVKHENGVQPYGIGIYDAGIVLATLKR